MAVAGIKKNRQQFDTTIKLPGRSMLPHHRLLAPQGGAPTIVSLWLRKSHPYLRHTPPVPPPPGHSHSNGVAHPPAPAVLGANRGAAGRGGRARCGLCLSDRGSGVNTGALIHQPFVMASPRLAPASSPAVLREEPRFIPLEGKKKEKTSVKTEHGHVRARSCVSFLQMVALT